MKDIAKALNLSVMTVSRTINNHPDVSEETRQRVLKLVKELNYRPNSIARSLVTRKTMVIGLVVPNISHSFFAEIAKGVQAVASEHGYSLFLCNTDEDTELEKKEIETLLDRRVDGLIVASAFPEKSVSHLRALQDAPHVLIDRRFHTRDSSWVVCDDEKVGFLATQHLIRLGYSRIAHIGGPAVSTAELRLKGYRKALRRFGVPVRRNLIYEGGFRESDGYRVAGEILNAKPRPDAIFAVNDPVAIGVLQRFYEEGIEVPEEIALVGAGDVRFVSMLRDPLTTVGFPKYEIGRRAMETLLEVIRKPDTVRRVVLRPELVIRETCGSKLGREKDRLAGNRRG